jgi:hypothetical protein
MNTYGRRSITNQGSNSITIRTVKPFKFMVLRYKQKSCTPTQSTNISHLIIYPTSLDVYLEVQTYQKSEPGIDQQGPVHKKCHRELQFELAHRTFGYQSNSGFEYRGVPTPIQ